MKEFKGLCRFADNTLQIVHVYAKSKASAIKTMMNLTYAKGVELI